MQGSRLLRMPIAEASLPVGPMGIDCGLLLPRVSGAFSDRTEALRTAEMGRYADRPVSTYHLDANARLICF